MQTIYTCFPGGRYKAITVSYDDGRIEDRELIRIFNKYGIRGTFHLNYGFLAGKDKEEEARYGRRIAETEIPSLYQGHEVAGHTLTHPTLTRVPEAQIIWQVMEDRKGLEAAAGYPVCGFSYPNGEYNEKLMQMLPMLGIAYARTAQSSGQYGLPDNYYEWNPTCHHNERLMEQTKRFLNRDRKQRLSLLYVWGHSYEFSNDNNWELIEEFAETAGGHDDIWYATNIEITRYMNASQNLVFYADGSGVYNPNAITVWVSVGERIYELTGGTEVKFEII